VTRWAVETTVLLGLAQGAVPRNSTSKPLSGSTRDRSQLAERSASGPMIKVGTAEYPARLRREWQAFKLRQPGQSFKSLARHGAGPAQLVPGS
jgi:hypothetical protein